MLENVKQYLKSIERDLMVGKATEGTHRPALKTFIDAFSPKIRATNEPRRDRDGCTLIKNNTSKGYL